MIIERVAGESLTWGDTVHPRLSRQRVDVGSHQVAPGQNPLDLAWNEPASQCLVELRARQCLDLRPERAVNRGEVPDACSTGPEGTND